MPLFHINIEKVVVRQDEEVIELLKEIKCLLSKDEDPAKQEIMDKLEKAISQIKSIIKN